MFEHIPDKDTDRKTTSRKLKQDLYNFMVENKVNKERYIEFGSWKGDLCYAMSLYFKEVIGIDITPEKTRKKYLDIDNIKIVKFDLYDIDKTILSVVKKADFVFIDADHHYKQVLRDIQQAFKLKPKYIGFDDYGLSSTHMIHVKQVVDEVVNQKKIKIIKEIGHTKILPNNMKLIGSEGVVCEVL